MTSSTSTTTLDKPTGPRLGMLKRRSFSGPLASLSAKAAGLRADSPSSNKPSAGRKNSSVVDMEALLSAYPYFAEAQAQFTAFLTAAEEDLKSKSESLRLQRGSLQQGQLGLKQYLDCQLFMLTRHARRLDRFSGEIRGRLLAISERYACAMGRRDCTVVEEDEEDNAPKEKEKKLDPCVEEEVKVDEDAITQVEIVVVPEEDADKKKQTDSELQQLLSDIGKMKRRCKHILDVTDRYCVLTSTDLRLKDDPTAHAQRTRRASASTLDSVGGEVVQEQVDFRCASSMSDSSVGSTSFNENMLDSPAVQGSPLPGSASAVSSPVLLPSQITGNIVKSTIMSFGNHLSVIAKTYTRKKGSNGESNTI